MELLFISLLYLPPFTVMRMGLLSGSIVALKLPLLSVLVVTSAGEMLAPVLASTAFTVTLLAAIGPCTAIPCSAVVGVAVGVAVLVAVAVAVAVFVAVAVAVAV